jgi:hypothetical protein
VNCFLSQVKIWQALTKGVWVVLFGHYVSNNVVKNILTSVTKWEATTRAINKIDMYMLNNEDVKMLDFGVILVVTFSTNQK